MEEHGLGTAAELTGVWVISVYFIHFMWTLFITSGR